MKSTIVKWAKRNPMLFWCVTGALLSLAVNGLFLFACWYTVSSIGHGGRMVSLLSCFAVLSAAVAPVAIPVCAVALLVRTVRNGALVILVASAVSLGIWRPCLRAGQRIRMAAFHRQAERGAAVVQAIKRYEATHGRPPPTLETLVPSLLPGVPSTGMPAYPEWCYKAGHGAHEWDGNPWVLYMNCSWLFCQFDMFMYFPKQNYPETGYGGGLERIKDWAYVHE